MVYFPTQTVSYSRRTDLVNTIMALDINSLQIEVEALEATLGSGSGAGTSNILFSTWDATSFSPATEQWTTFNDRVVNIERGLKNGVLSAPYVRKDLANAVSVSSGVPITVTKATGNTSDLIQFKDGSGTLGFNVNKDAMPKVGTGDVVYVGGSVYTTLDGRLTTAENRTMTPGPQGTTGAVGPKGDQGLQGTTGAQGIAGSGLQGTTGTQGLQGLQGIQGFGYAQLQGTVGSTGSQGVQGPVGIQGVQGIQGIQGFTFSGTANRAVLTDGSGLLAVSSVTNTELGYLSGVTSTIQTQLNSRLQTSVSGAKIFIQTSEPVANAVGDVWISY